MTPPTTHARTPGFKAVLIADAAYHGLKEYQSWRACGHLPVRFDLKDIATAFVEEALAIPGFQERVLRRALFNVSTVVVASSSAALPSAPSHSKE